MPSPLMILKSSVKYSSGKMRSLLHGLGHWLLSILPMGVAMWL